MNLYDLIKTLKQHLEAGLLKRQARVEEAEQDLREQRDRYDSHTSW